ncbi:hypothetical protein [Rhodococcus sp. 24CO]|uniref:hypothetical protein n=1 Tax=Rhodococcus sp. 24CO TaxID=3117460 RepID=UPI003D33D4C0
MNLNVWAPEDAGAEPLPVIVYIFGGGWELGANTQTTSNAAGLATTGRAIGSREIGTPTVVSAPT